MSLTQKWLRQHVQPYSNPHRVYVDIDTILTRYPTLRPKSDVFIFDDGRSQLLLCVHGLLPISYRGASYNIPMAFWITREYPKLPPISYVMPTNDMLVKPGKYLDVSGRCNIEYIQNWERKSEGCNLITLLESLQIHFSLEPPVYTKPKDGPSAPQSLSTDRDHADVPPPLPSRVSIAHPSSGSQPDRPMVPSKPPSMILSGPLLNPSPGSSALPQSVPPTPPPYPPLEKVTNIPYPKKFPVSPVPQPTGPNIYRSPPAPPILAPTLPAVPPPLVPPPVPPHLQSHVIPGHTERLDPPRPEPIAIPDLLDQDDNLTSNSSFELPVANKMLSLSPPPRPPNPELVRLYAEVQAKLKSELDSLKQALTLDAERLRAHQADLLSGEPAIKDEMARLAAVHDICCSVSDRTGVAVREAEANVADLRRKGDPAVDELVCATTIVHNQLINLIADDNAIEDTIYHLHRALNVGRIDLERFLRSTRILAEEQFMKRALAEKIQLIVASVPSSTIAPDWS